VEEWNAGGIGTMEKWNSRRMDWWWNWNNGIME
jgi:hypothetical protein